MFHVFAWIKINTLRLLSLCYILLPQMWIYNEIKVLPFLISDNFDSDHLICLVVIAFDHLTKWAFTQHFENFISIHHVVMHDLKNNQCRKQLEGAEYTPYPRSQARKKCKYFKNLYEQKVIEYRKKIMNICTWKIKKCSY